MEPLGHPKEEYAECGENMRNWANLRFAQMTLFVAINGAMLTGFFQSTKLTLTAKGALSLGGLLIAVIFGLLDLRTLSFWRHFRERAIELEVCLGYQQYRNDPARRWLASSAGVPLLFVMFFLFWAMALMFPLWF